MAADPGAPLCADGRSSWNLWRQAIDFAKHVSSYGTPDCHHVVVTRGRAGLRVEQQTAVTIFGRRLRPPGWPLWGQGSPAAAVEPPYRRSTRTELSSNLALAHALRVVQLVEIPHAWGQGGHLGAQQVFQIGITSPAGCAPCEVLFAHSCPQPRPHVVHDPVGRSPDDPCTGHLNFRSEFPECNSRLLNQVLDVGWRHVVARSNTSDKVTELSGF
jgi:hypothetical protein